MTESNLGVHVPSYTPNYPSNSFENVSSQGEEPPKSLFQTFFSLSFKLSSCTDESLAAKAIDRSLGSLQISALWPVTDSGDSHFYVIFLPLGPMSTSAPIDLRSVLAHKLNEKLSELDFESLVSAEDTKIDQNFKKAWQDTILAICTSFHVNWQKSRDSNESCANMQEFLRMIQVTSQQPNSVLKHDEEDRWTRFFFDLEDSGSQACFIFGSVTDEEQFELALSCLQQYLNEKKVHQQYSPQEYNKLLEVSRDELEILRDDVQSGLRDD